MGALGSGAGPTVPVQVSREGADGMPALADERLQRISMRQLTDENSPNAHKTKQECAARDTDEDDDIEGWMQLLRDVEDVRFDRLGPAEEWHSVVQLDAGIVRQIEAWCKAKGLSPFVFALHATRYVLWAYSHVPFALGVAHNARSLECISALGKFDHPVLMPFGSKLELVEEVQRRWVHEVLPRARTPFGALVRAIGAEPNTYLWKRIKQDIKARYIKKFGRKHADAE